MQPHLLENLRTRLRELNLDKYESRLLPHVRLAFDLRLNGESQGALGESRWGGAPDVPAGVEWPRNNGAPLGFLAQINLADLLPDNENPFPASGLLQFFTAFEFENGSLAYFIPLLDSALELHASTLPDDYNNPFGNMPAHCLKLEPRADLPQWATSDHTELTQDLSDEEHDAYSDLSLSDVYAPTSARQSLAGQFLGHTAGIGYDPREEAFARHELDKGYPFESENPVHRSGAKRWQNLLRFDSVLKLCIWDAGYFNFLLHEEDLKHLDFSRVDVTIESS